MKRIHFIDIAKSFAIIIIVFGHTCVHSAHCAMIFKILYSFNVPLFFILSGFTFKVDDKLSFKFAIKKFKRIMIPYFVWAFVFLIIYMLMGTSVADSLNIQSEPNLVKILIGNGNNNALKQNTSLWFLPALFSLEILNYFVFSLLKNRKKTYIYIYFIISILLGYVGYNFLQFNLFWGANNFIYINCFFILGFILNNSSFLDKKNSKFYIILLSFIGLLFGIYNGTISWADYDYNNYIFMIISGISISLFLIFISYLIKTNALLEYIGRNTMGILLFHKLIILLFQTKAGVLSRLLINSNLYIEVLLSVLITFISIIVSLGIAYLIKLYFPILIGEKMRRKYVE